MERVDTGDEAEGHVVGVFATEVCALDTRVILEGRAHPSHDLGYRYHFEMEEHRVHEAALTEADVKRGCVDELTPPS